MDAQGFTKDVQSLTKCVRCLLLELVKNPDIQSEIREGSRTLLRSVGMTVTPNYLKLSETEFLAITRRLAKVKYMTVEQPSRIQVGPVSLGSVDGKHYGCSDFLCGLYDLHIFFEAGEWIGRIYTNPCCFKETVFSTDPLPTLEEVRVQMEGGLHTILESKRSELTGLLKWTVAYEHTLMKKECLDQPTHAPVPPLQPS